MKKSVVILLAFVLLLSACSSTRYKMSDQHEKYGRKALEIVDAYLDFDLTDEEASEKLDSLQKSEGALPEDTDVEKFGNLLVTSDVSFLCFSFHQLQYGSSYGEDPAAKILEHRNDLAELLGEEAR